MTTKAITETNDGPFTKIQKNRLCLPVTFAINIKHIAGRAAMAARIDKFSTITYL